MPAIPSSDSPTAGNHASGSPGIRGGTGRTKVYAFAGRFSYAQPTILAIAEFSGVTILETDNRDPDSVVQDHTLRPNNNQRLLVGGGPIGDRVDSGVGAMYQDELTFGIERAVDPSLTLGLKATYRSLGRGLESRCDFLPADGYTNCAIINPGSDGQYARGDAPVTNGYDEPFDREDPSGGPASPAAKRIYRGIEILVRKSIGQSLWLQASYVYSSLRGNYDGAVNQSSYGGNSVSSNIDFDYPQMWHDAYGRLDLDRTNRFRLDGYWVTPWALTLGLQAFAESGAPLNRTGYFNQNYGSVIYLVPRGSAGSLPALWEANLTLAYPIVLGPATVTLQAYLYNIFNHQTPTLRDQVWTNGQVEGYPYSIFNADVQSTNDDYGKNQTRYAPRSFRAAVRVSF